MTSSILGFALVIGVSAPVAALAAPPPPAEQAAIFKAAGFRKLKAGWGTECGLTPSVSYGPGVIEQMRDINGDGRPEAIVTESSAMCYGMSGTQFWLLSKQASGAWTVMTSTTGMPELLKTRGVGGYPDVSIGGPGFCFPVQRWNGRAYAVHRWQYEGKPCKRP